MTFTLSDISSIVTLRYKHKFFFYLFIFFPRDKKEMKQMAKKKRNLISSLAQNPKSWRKRKSSKLWSLLKKVSSAFFVFLRD